MKKVILLVRVSTVYQKTDSQKQELIEYVKGDGYTENEMEIIEDKESATKLSDEERQGLNKMYEAINNPDNQIEAVYCWELSRLSRKPESLYKVRNELLNKKIDLRTKHEHFRLLNSNKEMDRNSNTMLGFYISMCENEILQKVERTKRVKIKKALEGKYTGGLIKYGYSYDEETKKYEVNREEAAIIRLVFALYETGKYGLNTLYKEMIKRGCKINIHQVNRILTSPEYTGGIRPEYTEVQKRRKQKEDRIIHRYNRYYPGIIGKEQYDKCREIAKQNNTNIDKSKNIYYAHKLIKCSSCGAYLVAAKHTVQYQCPKKYSPLTNVECNASDRINVNVIDSLLWHTVKNREADFIVNQSKEQIAEYQSIISELQTKINAIEERYKNVWEEKRKQIKKFFPYKTEKEIDSLTTESTVNDKREIEENKVSWGNEIERLNNLINDLENKHNSYSYIDKKLNEVIDIRYIKGELDKITDDTIRYDLIHKHIKEVTISNVIKNHTKQLDIYFYSLKKGTFNFENRETYYYDHKKVNEKKKLYYFSTYDRDYIEVPIVDDNEKKRFLLTGEHHQRFLSFEIEKRYTR
ncbi:MAG: recombinase family protein [Prevotellaceae bacterium]|jgi:DNA invertase Pin-like site-specific DNA recombinase|nr:recombinase family protein [Prevotellaceae bacterium]